MKKAIIPIMFALAITVMPPVAAGALTHLNVNEQDRTFLRKAHQGNLAEIQAGQAAQDMGASQAVKDLGARLVSDHTKMDDDVSRVAKQAGVDLPDKPSAAQRRQLGEVAGKSGEAFDRAWLATQIAGHRQSLANGATELRKGSSPEVKQLATDAKPIVQKHLDLLLEAKGGT
jgi:putative membrane protein